MMLLRMAHVEDLEALAREVAAAPDGRPERLVEISRATEPEAPYYRFLYELGRRYEIPEALEIGTYVGVSAAHLAWANPANRVLTVDHEPDAARKVREIGLPNVDPVTSDSVAFGAVLGRDPLRRFDLLFIDGNHTFNQAWSELLAYWDVLLPGAVVLWDDIDLPMATREMQALWEFVPGPKENVSFLHATGFGISKKGEARPMSHRAVLGRAGRRMEELQALAKGGKP